MAAFAEMSYTADFHCEKNNQQHRTDEITTKRLIIRRGQTFHITLRVNMNEYTIDHNNILFIAETGPKPSEASGTKVLFQLRSIDPRWWSGAVVSSTGTTLVLTVSPPPNARIGQYTLTLLSPMGQQIMKYRLGEFILLFNPWCREDEVFLDSEEQRQEYVLNEDGIIYNGSCHQIQSRSWYFGQFEESVVDICLKILDKNIKCQNNPAKDYIRRNDPVYISRVVTAMVNCADDKGVLAGKWNEPYSGGVYPWSWNGSVPILHQWYKGGFLPVRYGQCWVFAAVACTVLRCLGIPSRVVTNFNSAHDTNCNLTIDEEIDECGRLLGEDVWNFHVWVESWMARSDLKPGYDGWQALDPTPQEKSEGIYCCGPAPVKAIKEGAVEMKYDVPFVFAEVNADVVTWMCCRDGRKVKTSVKTQHVGQYISTKSCGSNDREDITYNYKYPEGSHKERAIFDEAQFRNKLQPPQEEKLLAHVKTHESVNYGSDIHAVVNISNNSSESMVCKLHLNAQILKYTGSAVKQIMVLSVNEVVVKGNEVTTMPVDVPFREFGNYLENHQLLKLIAVVADTRTNENALAVKDISVVKPAIIVNILGVAILNQVLTAEISFRNQLTEPLYDCVFTVEGVGLIDGMQQIRVGEIKANDEIAFKVQFIPHKSGLRKLMVDLDCNRMKDVKGFKNVVVQCF
ncbi:protein-glutamine gamma-glutamyltransferase 2-like [Pristis pectinata]|uniref:protein-glutamine gamma-glutamyltransferase 2-like n=1 Tax=Pristis pectinata TaxID=685728 RepID=UPI00223E0F46|nr:protein-glutamine gamma-glutamyltransferase 2-like [Pristis pectinata]